jgi:septum formation topological specificity factor MinE
VTTILDDYMLRLHVTKKKKKKPRSRLQIILRQERNQFFKLSDVLMTFL